MVGVRSQLEVHEVVAHDARGQRRERVDDLLHRARAPRLTSSTERVDDLLNLAHLPAALRVLPASPVALFVFPLPLTLLVLALALPFLPADATCRVVAFITIHFCAAAGVLHVSPADVDAQRRTTPRLVV